MSSEKPHRIRVKVLDGKPHERNKLKGKLLPHVDVIDVKDGIEFVICAVKEAHLDHVRAKLASAGMKELPGGDTNVSPPAPKPVNTPATRPGGQASRTSASHGSASSNADKLKPKPYGFVPLPGKLTTAPPVWHDGTGAQGRLSGEIRCEIETLMPLLVGWERRRIDDTEEPWAVPYSSATGDLHPLLGQAAHQAYPDANDQDEQKRQRKQRKVENSRRDYIDRMFKEVVEIADVGRTTKTKSVLCSLRAPWGDRPVLIPGDSLKGLLRHELGALLAAPMERVAERSYSYRPNAMYPLKPENRFLVPRLARVPTGGVQTRPLGGELQVRVPTRLELFLAELEYHKKGTLDYRFDQQGGASYRGGQGAGERLNSKSSVHTSLKVLREAQLETADVPQAAQDGYLATVRHLVDLDYGHFSERHPDVPTTITGENARRRILEAAANVVFQPGDLIWVEWDTQKQCIISLGWHYYYRWAYTGTVREKGWTDERHGLFPLEAERIPDAEGAPAGLSAVRQLFGYTGDNAGSAGIGTGDHAQLMGRISVNAAIEVVEPGDTAEKRFLSPTFLKELGMPRPSAVEHYLEQPYHPNPRPSDRASLVTYGDAVGYDEPGKLAGRKFYLDREDAYTGEPWKDHSAANRCNERSTLALEASCSGRRFRFTVRFRDLDPAELAAVLVALCPHQFRDMLGGSHPDGYCSKLGYARPLGWGTIRIDSKALLFLNTSGDEPALDPVDDLTKWLGQHFEKTPMLERWLAIHRRKHPDAADYPRGQDGNIYSYHTKLRADHSRARRYNREGGR